MVLILFLSCLIFYCMTFSWFKIWRSMTDSTPVTSSKREASDTLTEEPLPASQGSQELPQKHSAGLSLPKSPDQMEPASHRGPRVACQRRNSLPRSHQKPPRNPQSSNETWSSPEFQTNGSGAQDLEASDTSGLSSLARPPGQQATSPSKEDKKQAHIKRQLMTNFILGSFDDNSSDEDPSAGSFKSSSRKGSRASLGTLSLEASAIGESENHIPIIR